MSEATRVPIEPKTLAWVINQMGEAVAMARAGPKLQPKLRDWLEGRSQPTYNQAVTLGRRMGVSLIELLGPPPGPIVLPLPYRRRAGGLGPPLLDVRAVVYDAIRKQSWWKANLEGGACPLYGLAQTLREDVERVAAELRQKISVDRLRERSSSWSEFKRGLVNQLERFNVLVIQRGYLGQNPKHKLEAGALAGFSIPDPKAPLIFINTNDYVSSQVFTIAHEIAHITCGQPAIDDRLECDEEDQLPDEERICDKIAVELLVPREIFLARWAESTDENELARYFKVSLWVILRRALELGKLTRREYFMRMEKYREELTKSATKPGALRQEHRRSVATVVETLSGKTFARTVADAVLRGELTYSEAANLLWMSLKAFLTYLDVRERRTSRMRTR